MPWFKRYEPTPLEHILDPSAAGLKNLSPHNLIEYKAGWKEGSVNWLLADQEQRRREGWSGPVKLALALSGVSGALSIFALWRTL